MKIIIPFCECGHDILDHNNYKKKFCWKCKCQEFKKKKK